MAAENAMTANEPDFGGAAKILRDTIAELRDAQSKGQGNLSAAWKRVEQEAGCEKDAAKIVFKLHNKSPAFISDWLRTFFGLAKEFNLLNEAGNGPKLDLVDMAEDGSDDEDEDQVGENQ